MAEPAAKSPEPASPATPAPPRAAAYQWLEPTFRWHLRVFLVANIGLTTANVFTGKPWWSFWPLVVTGFALAVHYFFYKAMAVDEHWVAERAEELNLKSYDRGHIEDLKSRYGADKSLGDDRR